MRPPLLPTSTALPATSSSSFRPEDIPPRQSISKPEDRPPLISSLPLPLPHGDDLPPRLHVDRNFAPPPRDRYRSNSDLDHSHNDDPFAPSVYELRAMERNSLIRPPPQPHHSGIYFLLKNAHI